MTFEIGLLFAIILVSLILFSFERIPADVIALGVMLSLILFGLLPAEEAFAGFGSDAVIMILGLLILTAALLHTGVVEMAGRTILRHTGDNPDKLLILVMLSVATLSAFISNTAATAFFVPVVIGVARSAKVSPSKLLMPLAFASILTSSVTLVSTSTNIVVSGLMTQNGMAPLGMFEMAPVGIPVAVAGILYMYTVGRRLTPDRGQDEATAETYGLRPYLTEVMILPGSPWAGKTLEGARLGAELNLTVLRVVRDKHRYMAPQADLALQEGDILLVEGQRDDLLKIKATAGIDIKADVKLSDPELQSEDYRLVEALIMLRSRLVGRTLKGMRFRERYGLQVLALNRRGEAITRKISQTALRVGDMLMLQGHRANIAALEAEELVAVIGAVDDPLPQTRRAPIAIGAFVAALLLATFGVVSFPVGAMLGVLVVFVARCITPTEAYREVEWKAIILIGSMLALGAAMVETGAAQYVAVVIEGWFGGANPRWLLAAFFVLTVLLTQPMSNQAAAVVVVPVALQTALQLGLNPRSFAVMIAVAASCSYLTPLEPSCLMVYGPGRYRFKDFLIVGALLTIIIFAIAMVLVPVIWPL